ncbi:hypothetical protein J6590_014778 [Homalodisca vitripennis]|nr:hypothetical protein J6590_014778 [Homalodisca vitripennis]
MLRELLIVNAFTNAEKVLVVPRRRGKKEFESPYFNFVALIYGHVYGENNSFFVLLSAFSLFQLIGQGSNLSFSTTEVDGEKRFVCSQCGRQYKVKGNLTKHQRQECCKEPQFHCSLCPYKAKQKGTLKTHMALKHVKFSV